MDFSNLKIDTPAFVFEQRVHKGAALLDVKAPGWAVHVDTEALEGSCSVHGVLGQVFPGTDDREQAEMLGLWLTPEEQAYGDAHPDEYTNAEAVVGRLVEHGYCTLVAELKEPPAFLREMGEFLGLPLPSKVPVPRDQDTVMLEASTLVEMWRREISARV